MDPQPRSAQAPAAPFTPRPYAIVATIGRGRSTELFLALAPPDSGLPRQVVVKALHADLLDDRDVCATFAHQARLAQALRHPNVLTTLGAGHDRDRPFMVLEFLGGQTLSRIRQRRDPINAVPLAIHLRVLVDALSGLHCFHELDVDDAPGGIVHGDVCPENLFVTCDGVTKVLHPAMDRADADTQVLKERLSYMSPEQARKDPVDRRSDLFSVGIVLWEAITGLRFWQDWHPTAIFNRLCSDSLPLHPQWVPVGMADLFHIVERAVSPNPDDRYQTAAEMRSAIEDILALGQGDASPAAVAAYMKATLAERARWDDADEPTLVRDTGDETTLVREAGDDPTLVRDVPVLEKDTTAAAIEANDAPPPSSKGGSTMGWTAPARTVSVVPPARRRHPRAFYASLGACAVIAGAVMLGAALFRLRDLQSRPGPSAPAPGAEMVAASVAPAAVPTIVPCPSFPEPTSTALPAAPPKQGEARNGTSWRPRRRNRVAEDPWGI